MKTEEKQQIKTALKKSQIANFKQTGKKYLTRGEQAQVLKSALGFLEIMGKLPE